MKHIEIISKYTNARPYTRVRLRHKDSAKGMYVSAKPFGFDDLIVEAYIRLSEEASMPITNELCEAWGADAKDVMITAMKNTESDGFEIIRLDEIVKQKSGLPIYVVTNKARNNGAIGAAILSGRLREMFPAGYTAIPSSIHEFIIIPRGFMPDEDTGFMIRDINAREVPISERLSDHPYNL